MVDNRIVDAYFNHGDSWESFREWNALGTGMPVVMNEKEHVVQYYHVPSLSGIQIYGEDSPQISLATLPPTSTRAPIPSRLAAGANLAHHVGRLRRLRRLWTVTASVDW